jgi:plastocyanin
MVGSTFSPAVRTVFSGAIVQWVNKDTLTHTVVLDSGPDTTFDSGDIVAGASFSHHFGTVGTYEYHCRIHGLPGAGMHGTLVVQ